MIVTCPGCARKYNIDAERLGGRTSATARCTHCGESIPVTVEPPAGGPQPQATKGEPAAGDATMRLPADASLLPAPERIEAGSPSLPEGMRVSLAVLEGREAGRMIRIESASVIIGRHGADILIDDPEVSRHHAQLEIHGGRAIVRDLGSTNGTFVNDRKVSESEIENRGEFRVGGTKLMLILTASEEAGG